VSYFAAAVARTADGWTGREVDLSEVEDLDALADELRDLVGDDAGPALLLLEEDDEYLAVVRVEAGSLADPRVFVSDLRAVQSSDVAAMLWADADASADDEDDEAEDDEEEGTRAVSEPVGDLGTSSGDLLDLCAEEGLLPADVLVALAERAGFAHVLDELRPV
jgi:putative tRNA adenosine deaminase-associated protein